MSTAPSAPARRGVRALASTAFLCLAVPAFLLASPVSPSWAMSGTELTSVTFSCTAVSATYTEVLFDRDNTGMGAERYELTITDGADVVLFHVSNTEALGGTFSAQTENFTYTAAPTANPIHLTLISPAGNGLPEQVIWDVSGECAALNLEPVVSPASYTVQRDATLSGALSDWVADPEGDVLEYALGSLDGTLGTVTLDTVTGDFSYTPASSGASTDTFPFLVSDGSSEPVPGVVTITITEPPAPASPALPASGNGNAAAQLALAALLVAAGAFAASRRWRPGASGR